MKTKLLLLLLCINVLTFGQSTDSTQVLNFPLDGTTQDISSNDITGTIIGSGVTPTSDRYGNSSGAMAFNGNGFIDIPYSISMGTNDFAVSFWALYDPANIGYVFTKDQACIGDNQLRIGGTGWNANQFQTNVIAYTPVTNIWNHIVFVRQGTVCSYYVNGILVQSVSNQTVSAFSNTIHFRIGAVYPCNGIVDPDQPLAYMGNVFKGKIDDLVMYNRALSETEIKNEYLQETPNNGLLAWYKLDNSSADSSGNTLNLTSYNVTATSDRYGKPNSAMKFGGVNNVGYMDILNSKLNVSNALTFSCWLNMDSFEGINGNGETSTDGMHCIFAKASDANGGTLMIKGSGLFYVGQGNSISNTLVSNNNYVANLLKKWNHVVLALTPTTYKIYVNGNLVYSATGTFVLPNLNDKGLSIGRFYNTFWYPLNGSLDDIKIYNRELSSTEVEGLFTENQGNEYAALEGYFPLNGNGTEAILNLQSTENGTMIPVIDRFGNANSAVRFDKGWYETQIAQSNVTEYSVSAWIKFNEGEVGQIVNNRTDGNDLNCRALSLSIENDNTLFFGINGADKLVGTYVSKKVNDGGWHHVVGVFKGTSGVAITQANFSVYVDGVLIPYTSHANDNLGMAAGQIPPFNGNGKTRIGNLPNILNGNSNSGIIDEVRIYNRVLTSQEISNFYNEGSFKTQNALNLANTSGTLSSATTGQYASVPADVWFNGDFTFDTWIYARSNYNKWERIFDFGQGQGVNNVLFAVNNGSNLPCFSIYSGTTPNNYIVNTPLPQNAWTQVTATLEGTTLNVYYNGNLVQTFTGVVVPPNVVRNINYIGRSNWTSDYYLNASVDEFRLYNRALSQEEIISNSHSQLQGDEAGLILYYNFNQVSGNTVTNLAEATSDGDASLFNNTGFNYSKALLTPFLRNTTNENTNSFMAHWDEVNGAIRYEIQTSLSHDFLNPEINISTTNSFIVPTGSPVVYYRVRAITQTETSDWVWGVSPNLLSNPGAESDYVNWTKVNGGSGWAICGGRTGLKAWISSYAYGSMSQTVDLLAKGFTAEQMDNIPTIDAGVYVANCGYYSIVVELLDIADVVLFADYIVNNVNECNSWTLKSKLISSYPVGVRKVRFTFIAKDNVYWAGNYGPIFDDAYVFINTSTPLNLSNLVVSNVTNSEATVSWTSDVNATKYEVEYSASSDFSNSEKKVATTNSYIIKPSYSPVYVRVRAITDVQSSLWNQTRFYTTPGVAVSLNGSSQYLQVPNGVYFDGDFTVDAWVKLNDGATYFRLFDFGNGAPSDNVLFSPTGNVMSIYVGGTGANLYASKTIPANEWTHVALTLNGSVASMYYNGELVGRNENMPIPTGVVTTLNYIGKDNWGGAYANASYDEFHIYNYAMTQDSIIARSHRQMTGMEDGLILSYDFNTFNTTTVFDNSPNNYDATTMNAPVFDESRAIITPIIRQATDISGTSFTANWDQIPHAVSYEFEYSTSTISPKTISLTSNSYKIESLKDGDEISYKVRAIMPTMVSDWAVSSFTTPLVPPGNGLNLANVSTNKTTPQYAQVPAGVWFNGDLTVDSWVYLKDYSDNSHIRLFDFGNGTSDNILFSVSSPYGADFSIRSGTTVKDNYIQKVPLNKWTHVAMSMKGDSVFVYYDGKLILKTTSTLKAQNVSRSKNYIGESNWSTEPNPNIIIDEFRIYNKHITLDSLIARSHRHLSGTEDGLILYYDFDQLSGTTVTDLSSSKQNATLFNGVSFVNSLALLTPFTRNETNITETGFTANWDSIPNATYQIERALDRLFTVDLVSNTLSDNTIKYSSLISGLKYYYRVRAITNLETSEWAMDSVQCTQTIPGNAISLDGVDELIRITSTTATYKSFMFWCKLDENTGVDYLFDLRDASSTYNGYFYSAMSGIGRILINGEKSTITNANNLPRNEWFNVYVELPATANPVLYLTLGNRVVASEGMKGAFDELTVWNKALTANEIQKYMHNVPVSTASGLVAYCNFEGISGTSFTDVYGKGIVGTLGGTDYTNNSQSKALLTPFVKTPTNITTTGFSAHWDKIPGATYQVQNSTSTDFSSSNVQTLTDTVLTITGLTEATVYYTRVRAITATDTSEWDMGTVNTAMTVPGNALTINGNNIVSCSLTNPFPSIFTIETWLAPNATGLNGSFHAFLGGGSPTVPAMYVYGNQLHWKFYNASTGITLGATIPGFFDKADEWVHVSLVCDGNTVKSYKNGKLMNTYTIVLPYTINSQQTFTIGQYDNTYYGKIDEFRIWNTARTEKEIKEYLHATLSGNETGLVAYYNFDQMQGNTLPDLTGKNPAGAFSQVAPSWGASNAIITPFIRTTTDVSDIGFTVNWDKVPNKEYEFVFSINSDFTDSTVSQTTDTSMVLAGLQTGRQYFYRVRAIEGSSVSDWSTSSTITTSPIPGTALLLNGSTQYVQVAAGTHFNGDFTVDSWVYLNSYTGNCRIFDFGNGMGSDNVLFDPVRNLLSIYNVSAPSTLFANSKIPLNKWTHVAITLSNTTATIYYDGEIVGQSTSMQKPRGIVLNNNYIGKSNWNEQYLNALVDEFHIYNYALSQDSIIARSHRQMIGNETGMVLGYDFNSFDGSKISDITPNMKDGVLINKPTFEESKAIIQPIIREVDTIVSGNVVTEVKLSWDRIPVAANYVFQVSSTNNFATIDQDITTADTSASIMINGTDYVYYSRIKTITTDNIESDWLTYAFADTSVAIPNKAFSATQNITIANTADIRIPGNQNNTFAMWIKASDITSIPLYNQYGAATGQVGKMISIQNGKFTVQIDRNGYGWLSFISPVAITANTWNHVCYVQEGNKIYMYINGQKCIPTSDFYGTAGDNTLSTQHYTATASTNSGTLFGNSTYLMDDFQMWNKALTESEVSDMAHNTPVGTEANLLVAYDFNQINGTVIKDLSTTVATNSVTVENLDAWKPSNAIHTPFLTKVSNTTDSSLVVNWTEITDALKYVVKYSSLSTFATAESDTVAITSLALENLLPATKYYFTVKTISATDTSDWSAVKAFSTYSLTDNLIAYYPFKNSAADASGNGANGTIYGTVTPTTDRFEVENKAYNFAGGYISAGDKNDLDSVFTISCWISANSLTTGGILSKLELDNSLVSGYSISTESGLATATTGDAASYKSSYSDSTKLWANQWQFISITRTADSVLTIYINDKEVLDTIAPPSKDNAAQFVIGNLFPELNSVDPFDGKIDDIRLYNRILSKNELSKLYHENGWPFTTVKLDVANNAFKEQQSVGTLVGTLQQNKDAFVNDTSTIFSYILIGGEGSTDNAKFTIKNDSVLYSNYIFDVTQQTTASIRVRVTNLAGISFDRTLTVNIIDASESVIYDFNDLSIAPLASQDSWKTSLFNTTTDMQIIDKGNDLSNAMYFGIEGSGTGVSASNLLTNLFENISFDDMSAQYTIGFDISSSCWGTEVGIGYDNDNSGINKNSISKKAITVNSDYCVNNESVTIPDGSKISFLTGIPNEWSRIEISISNLNKSTATLSVKARSIANSNSSWIQLLNSTQIAIDTNAIDKMNPKLWNTFYVHVEGLTGIIDNLEFSKRMLNSDRATINDGLIAHYNLDNNIRDTTGNGLHGTTPTGAYSLPTPTANRFGIPNSAMYFDGASNFQIPNFGNNGSIEEVSISIWSNTSTNNSNSLFDTDPYNASNRINIHPRLSGSLYWDFGSITTSGRLQISSSQFVNNVWEHYVFISSKKDNCMKIYCNNILVGTKIGASSFTQADIALVIGDPSAAYVGSLDDIRIYDRVLSESEISSIYYDGGWPVQQITLPASVTVKAGNTFQLPVTVSPSNAPKTGLVYSVANSSVATIDNTGLISAKADGTTLITVTTANGSVSATTVLSVTDQYIPLADLNLTDSILTFIIGSGKNLLYTYAPKKATLSGLNWWSSDPSVAVVSSTGAVSTLAKGSAWIYIASDAAKTLVDSCKFIVLPSAIPVLTENDTAHFNLKAVSQTNGVWDEKDTLKINVPLFFSDDDSLSFSLYPISSPTDTLQAILKDSVIFVYQLNTDTISKPLTLTIRATDKDGQSVDKIAIIHLKSTPDLAPVVDSVPIVSALYQFRKVFTVDLKKYIHDDYTPLDQLRYDSLVMNSADTVIFKNGKMTLTVNPGTSKGYTDSVSFKILDKKDNGTVLKLYYTYKYVTNAAPQFLPIDTLIQSGDTTFIEIDVENYVSDDYTPNSLLRWSYERASNVNITLTGTKLVLSASSSAWNGTEIVKVYARDEAGLRGDFLIPFRQIVDVTLSGAPDVDITLLTEDNDPLPAIIARGTKVKAAIVDKSNGKIEVFNDWTCTFKGTSAGEVIGDNNTVVEYSNLGSFTVILTARNNVSTTTVTKLNAVNVVGIVANKTHICSDSLVTLSVSDSTQGYTLFWNNGKNTNSIVVSPKEITNYTLRITAGLNTIVNDNVTINVTQQKTNIADDITICEGVETAIQPTGFSNIWWNNSNVSSLTYSVNSSDTIPVKALVDPVCPVIKDTVIVNVKSIPVIGLPETLKLCDGIKDTIVATGGLNDASYSWNEATNYGDSMIVDRSGLYIVTVTGANGCINSDSTFATVAALPIVELFVDKDTICQNDTISFTYPGSINYAYSWSSGVLAGAKAVPSISGENKFTLTALDINGCINSSTVSVFVRQKPNVEIIAPLKDTICQGEAVTLTAINADNYLWNEGVVNGKSFNPASTNVYLVIGEDANGCSAMDSIKIVVNETPVMTTTVSTNGICLGDSILVSATSNATDTLTWNIDLTKDGYFVPSSIGSTDLIATAVNLNGCSSKDTVSVSVSQSAAFVVSISPNDTICAGVATTLNIVGDAAVYTISNSVVDGTPFVPAISGYYTITADLAGCITSDSLRIEVKETPQLTAIVSESGICSGDSVLVSATSNATDTLTWNIDLTKDGYFVPSSIGSTDLIATVVNLNGCSSTDTVSVSVSQSAAFVVSISPNDTICAGVATTLNIVGDAAVYTISNSVVDGTPFVPAISGYYTITADLAGCITSDSLHIEVKETPQLTVIASESGICSGDSVLVSATSNATDTLTWNIDLAKDGYFVPSSIGSTDLIATAVNLNGCSSTDTVSVSVSQSAAFVVSVSPNDTICAGVATTLNIVGDAADYSISNDVVEGSPFTATESGYYTITADLNGCITSDSINIIVNSLPDITVSCSNINPCPGTSIVLYGNGAVSYEWDNGVADSVAFIPENTTYTVTGTDTNNCSNSTSIAVAPHVVYQEEIKLTTFRNDDSGIIVAWTPTKGKGIAKYELWKVSDETGLYKKIADRGAKDSSFVVDKEADALVTAYLYELHTIDSVCTDTFATSAPHRTVHLSNLLTPNPSELELIWNDYWGIEFLTYTIYVFKNGEVIDSITKANTDGVDMFTYTYTKHQNGNSYRITFKLPEKVYTGTLKSDSGPFSQSMSNISEAELMGLDNMDDCSLILYPNPVESEFSIDFCEKITEIEIITANGQVVKKLIYNGGAIDVSDLQSGTYSIVIRTENKIVCSPFIKK